MLPRAFLIALVLVGVALTATVVPGVFTIDEDNYLVTVTALREGRLTVPGTEGLPPSNELVWFDPNGAAREVTETPVSSTAPPLYAPLALPFSYLGWRGLVGLSTLCFLLATVVVFLLTRRYARSPDSPWLAALAFAGGSYLLEYAQGVWPHMLTAALCIGAVLLTAQVRDGEAVWRALVAGLLAGLAAGVRYQNVVFAALLGLGVLLFTPRRWRSSLAYGAGLALPLLAASLINHARLGIWNPVSKGGTYISSMTRTLTSEGLVRDALTMGWARVVDYGTRPPLTGTEHAVYLRQDPATGAFLIGETMKKAWLQSSPWILLGLLALLLAWLPRLRRSAAGGAQPDPGEAGRRRELRALGLVVIPVLGMFAASGLLRTDGLSYNQRYFIELVPLVAVALAWLVEGVLPAGGDARRRGWWGRLAAGGVLGAALALAVLVRPAPSPIRLSGLLYLPLTLAVLLVVAWAVARFQRRPAILALVLGASLGWSLALHVGEDLSASREIRRGNARLAAILDPVLTDQTAFFAYWGAKDAVGPLLLDRDLVVLDVRNDGGRSAPLLARSFLDRGWRVVILPLGFPPQTGRAMTQGLDVRILRPPPIPLLELVPPGATANPPTVR